MAWDALRRRLVTVFVADYYSFIYLFCVSTIWADDKSSDECLQRTQNEKKKQIVKNIG